VKIQAVRGMQDLLPRQKEIFRFIEDTVRDVLRLYGYQEIGMPVIESTQLFKRLVGEATDIVEKEMYTFDDRSGDSLTLRPEGTAGCVRMAQENGLIFNQIQRFWYTGPMFRYERPQKGRYRQFEQIGVECFGMAGADIDAELLMMTHRMWQALGITDKVHLELNSLGSTASRTAYREALVGFLGNVRDELDEDSQRRLETNPLRILDSKVEKTRSILEDAPLLSEFLDEESQQHFDTLRRVLDKQQMPYRVNPYIVRGLDYYNKTVFEWITDSLGAQGTVCGGGRYDGLVEQVGGRATPGVGFAMGLDRLAMMLEDSFESTAAADVYIASMGDTARDFALSLAEDLRGQLDNCAVVVHCADGKLKSQMKKADASAARIALIIGEDEVARGEVTIKHLATGEQSAMAAGKVADYLRQTISKE
jgi:histidyl-tRNA synthetase